jgi:hypothetical protein
MSRTAKEYTYPLRLPKETRPEVVKLVKQTGQSINSVLVLCIRKGLPLAREALCHTNDRVTKVDPLPESVLERIYSQRDELDGIGAEQLAGFQIQ